MGPRYRRLTFVESYLVPRYRRLTFVESYLVPRYRRLTFVESYSRTSLSTINFCRVVHSYLAIDEHGGRGSIAGIAQHSIPISIIKEIPFKIFPSASFFQRNSFKNFFHIIFFTGKSLLKKFKNHLQFYMKILLKKFSSFFAGKSLYNFFQ